MVEPHSPTARARLLGSTLREIRERLGMSQGAVGKALGWSYQKVRRIEEALTRPEVEDLEALLDVYGIDRGSRLELLELSENSWRRGWWPDYGGIFHGKFISLEDEAIRIREYETLLVPGLLQTAEYSREVIRAVRPGDSDEDIQRRVKGRLARKELLSRESAPSLHVILDEAVLRRTVGGHAVMNGQLEELVAASRRANIIIQVVRFADGAHAGLEGPFSILAFEEPAPQIAYVEGMSRDAYLESAGEVARCNLTFERLRDAALDPQESAAMIADIIKE